MRRFLLGLSSRRAIFYPTELLIDRFGGRFVMAAGGPMQVAGRVGELVFAKQAAPELIGKLTFTILPTALAGLLFLGIEEWVVAAFCGLYGLSNGILTIVRGTVPQKLFGRENYGAIADLSTAFC